MHTNKFILAASMIALGLLGQPGLSQASDGDYSRWSGHHHSDSADADETHGWSHLADRLNLSEEQRQSMKAINEKYRPELHDLRQQLMDNRAALAKMDATDVRLHEQAEAQCKISTRMIIARKNMRSEMDKVLTDEQRQKLKMMFEYMGNRRSWHDESAPS